MISKQTFARIVVLALVPLSTAQAADMPEPFDQPLPTLAAQSGWYLRGDFGYRWNTIQSATAGVFNLDSNAIDSGFWLGTGVGFRARWLRADLTLDYAPAVEYTGTAIVPGDTSAKIDSITALFNIYFDLGTWWGLTPYVGAGLGTSYLRTSDVVTPGIISDGGGKWNFSYAAMAGISYAVARNLSVDVGYRFLHLGDAANDAGTAVFENINAHELRVGVRWMFNDAVAIP